MFSRPGLVAQVKSDGRGGGTFVNFLLTRYGTLLRMAIEDELRAALTQRASNLLKVARSSLAQALIMPTDPAFWLTSIHWAQGLLRGAEVTEAAILVRSGVPWSVLAQRQGRTRQALHRRLSTDAEFWRTSVWNESKNAAAALGDAAYLRNWLEAAHYAALLKGPDVFYGGMARDLSDLRLQPRWWEKPEAAHRRI